MSQLPNVFSGLAVAAAVALAAPAAMAQKADYTAEEIIERFAKEPKTRGVTFGPTGFGKTADATTDAAKPKDAAVAATTAPDAFNLMVSFDYNSDTLTGQARRNLATFAEALKRPELSTMKFAVDGHTDASGAESYNQTLSERRAASVVRFLTEQGVPAERLVARGFGETQPADTANPAANRRVETKPIE